VLLHGPEESQERKLTIVGVVVVLVCVAVAAPLIFFNPFSGRLAHRISVVIDTPYVGQGVGVGTAMVMHGVKVGDVTAVESLPSGGVRVRADLQKGPTAGLTDAMNIDFRPVNYFGVTGINLLAGTGGQLLRDGIRVNTRPTGNYTLQALLSRLGSVTDAAVTPQLIQVVDRATRYTDALNPLIETMLIAANAFAVAQTVPTAQLLTNATGLTVVLPPFIASATDTTDRLDHTGVDSMSEDFYRNRLMKSNDLATYALFDRLGALEGKHMTELLPFLDVTKAITDIVPGLIRPQSLQQELLELRTRLEKMYSGTPEQRALQVRVVLDSLPGVAGPLAAIGGP
jgi:hypothetical protein